MRFNLLLIVFIGIIAGCTDLDYPQVFPVVLTEEIIHISSEGAEFVGSIRSFGSDQKVVRYGFVWSEDQQPDLDASFSTIADPVKQGRFSILVKSNLTEGRVYYVRAFVQTSTLTVYGNQLSFTSKGSLPPVINDFNPKKGFDGTEITISGKNFSEATDGNRVHIGGVAASVISAADSELKVVVPASVLVGDYKIVVEVAQQSAVSADDFTILGPRIHSFSVLSARVGDLLTLDGEYFSLGNNLMLYFGAPEQGVSNYSTPVATSPHQLEAYVPDHAGFVGQAELYSELSGQEKKFMFPATFTIKNSWSKTSEQLPVQNFNGYSSAMIDQVVYILGGRGLHAYNTATKQWYQKSDFPGAYRFFGTAFAHGGKLYYGFGEGHHAPMAGFNGSYYNDLWVYDPGMNSWTYVGELPLTKRSRMLSMVINNKVYLGFGAVQWPNSRTFTDFWEYDLFTKTAKNIDSPAQGYTFQPTTFVLGNKGYVIGLERPGVSWNRAADFLEFDASTNTWTTKEDFPDMINGEQASVRNGHGLVLVADMNVGVNRVYEWVPEKEIWIRRQSLHGMYTSGYFVFAHYYNSKLYYGNGQLWELSFD